MRLGVTLLDPTRSGTPVDVEVTATPGSPLGSLRTELLGAVGRRDGTLFAGGRALDDDAAWGQPPLLDGAVLTLDRPEQREPRGLLELHVVAGPDSGMVHHLVPGEHSIGRVAEATIRVDDPDVSRLHAVIRVGHLDGGSTVRDLGSTNGSTVDGRQIGFDASPLAPGQLLRVGETRMTLVVPEPVAVSCRADGLGRLEVNRPPRHLQPPSPVTVALPAEPMSREHGRFPWLAILLPMLAGVALVAITRSTTYFLFLLLSPLMAAGTFLSDRVGGRRSARTQRMAYDEECARARDTVARALTEETTALLRAHPGPAALAVTASGPRPRLWERRPADDDALDLRLGMGTVPSTVTVRTPGAGGRQEEVEQPDLTDAPVTVSLAAAGVLGLAGDRNRALPLARSMVAQLAGWHSPRHLSLVMLSTAPAPDWEWVRRLPHLRTEDGPLRVALDRVQVRARVDELLALIEARADQLNQSRGFDRAWTGPTTVVILDGAGTLRREAGVARLLDEGPAVGLRVLALERDLVSLPVECRATVEVTGQVGTRLRVVGPDGSTYDDVVADGVSDRWAHRFARALAPLRDATPDDRAASLPDTVRLLDLLPFDATDPAALETAWLVSPRSTTVPLGVGSDGDPVALDIAADGPHALVAGTTGSGKSELLQTLVAGLAVGNRPDEISFVLIDYKGGAAFKDCARLPHTVGMVTDLDGHLTERALRSLGAELRRREDLLRGAGCKDLDDYLAQAPAGSPPIPRLVLVVDEFATLAEELPDFVGGLVGIAQRGRSLGVHLVLATQRPGGAVSADIRANTGLRIALRVTDPAESTDVVDVPDAAGIGRGHPGRSVVRIGAGVVRTVQTARVGGHAVNDTQPQVRAVPWERAGDDTPRSELAQPSGPSDLARLVDAACDAAERLATGPAPTPWLPPLPGIVTVDDLAGLPVPHSPVIYGVADLPDEQRQAAVSFAVDGGDHLLVAGSARSGRSTLLRTLAAGLAARWDVADLHLFALDGGGGALGPLAELPHCGAVVGRDEPARGDRLLSRLAEEVEARQRLLAASGYGSVEEQRAGTTGAERLPWIVLLADGWEGFAAAYEAVDHGRPLDTLLRLVREGAAAGIRVVLTGDRAVLSGRAAAAFRDRIVLRLADRADYGLAGISPRQVPGDLPAGRALVGPDALEAQLAVLDPDTSGAGQLRALQEVATRARAAATGAAPWQLPLRVEPLPSRVEVGDVEAAAKAIEPGPGWALVGVGGDELLPVGIDLDLDGPAFVVAGPPGSGRSTTLATMGRWALGRGRPVVVVAHRRSPLRVLANEAGVVAAVGSGDVFDLEQTLSGHPDALVLADDAETLHDTALERPLLGLLRADAEGAASLVLAGSAQEMAGMFRGLTVEARRTRTGLLLGALSPIDGDLLGVRVTRCDAAPPGRGVLVVRGRPTPVQVARSPL